MSIPRETVQSTILAAQLKIATMTNANLTILTGGSSSVQWGAVKKAQRGVNAVSRQYSLNDFSSDHFLLAYSCLQNFVGTSGIGTLNPNAQTPNVIFDIIIPISVNALRISFSSLTTITLSAYQATYSAIYGNFPDISIWTDNGNGSNTQDTATVPTVVNLNGDINLPDSYTWVYAIPTSGYIQISGFITP